MQTSPLGYTVRCQLSSRESSFAEASPLLHHHHHLVCLRPGSSLRVSRTVRMPHLNQELHLRRRERVVLGKLQFRREYASLERRVFRPLYERLPHEHIVLRYRACSDAFRRV